MVYVHLYGVAFHFFARAVDPLLQMATRQQTARVFEQRLQNGELFDGQGNGPTAYGEGAGRRIHEQITVAQQLGGLTTEATGQGPDAGAQLIHVEGLDHIVIGPAVQGTHPVDDLASGCQHQHRHLTPRLTHPLQYLESGQLG